MTEKTVGELQAELDMLKKQNLERQIAAEKAKFEEEEALKAKEAEEKLRKELYEEAKLKVMEEMGEKTTIDGGNAPETMSATNGKLQLLKENHTKKYGLTGKTYEERIRDLVDRGYKWE